MAGARARASHRRRVLERDTCLTWQVHVHARRRGGACLRETPALHDRANVNQRVRRSGTASDRLQPAYARTRYRRSLNSDAPSSKAASRRRYIRHTPAGRNMRLPQGCSMASPITTDLGQGVSHAQPCVVLRRFARKVRARGISGEEFNQYLYQSLHSTGRATEREDSVRYRRRR